MPFCNPELHLTSFPSPPPPPVPPTITSSFPALVANVTEEVRMRCGVSASEGSEVNWVWWLNGTEIVATERVQYDQTGLVREREGESRERSSFYSSFTSPSLSPPPSLPLPLSPSLFPPPVLLPPHHCGGGGRPRSLPVCGHPEQHWKGGSLQPAAENYM